MEANEPGFILLIVKILIAKISYPFIQAVCAAWMNAYDSKRVNGKLNQLKDHLIEFFHLPEVEDDTNWENDRNEFLK